MPTILSNPFVYNLQKILDTVPAPNLFSLSNYLFEDGMLLTILSQYPTRYSIPLLSLLQTVDSYLIQYFLAIYTTFTYYSRTV